MHFYRERILGDNNQGLLISIMNFGYWYLDMKNYTLCLKLWSYANKVSQKKNQAVLIEIIQIIEVNNI